MTLDNAEATEPRRDDNLYLSRDGSLYLSGNYAPVLDEVTAYDLPVDGQVPAELSGRLIRVGPNPINPVDDPVNHNWLTGTGMLHGVRLRDGRITVGLAASGRDHRRGAHGPRNRPGFPARRIGGPGVGSR
jgi:carotenoid cleavage dioxygenase-like enzyme